MAKKYTLKRVNKTPEVAPRPDESKFQINYQMELNHSQFEAASAVNGAHLVIAGAGTGKTRTLVYRVARLVELGYDPKSILLLTFTRKAAREMMNRASLLLDNRCAKVNGGTFHSFANFTLRKYYKYVGLDPNFTILDQSDSEDIVNLIRSQLNISEMKKRFPKKSTIFKILSYAVNTNKPIDIIVAEDYPHFNDFIDQIIDINNVYQSYKHKNGLLDYDDLLLYLRDFLLEYGLGAQHLLQGINFVMVDEYQDTNHIQAEIVRGLTQKNQNVMVVGDDSQSIYAFRGASFKNIMEFPNLFPDANIIKLEENYRSTQEILNFTNYIIDSAIEKYPKQLYTSKIGGELPAIISAKTENLQSKFITERILELNEEGIPLKEMAVLFRSSFFSFDLEIELNKAGIPFQKFGGMKFIETAHVKDVLAFIRIAANPKDIISWFRILLLHEGIGPKKAQLILDELSRTQVNFNEKPDAIIKLSKKKSLNPLFELLSNIHHNHPMPADKVELVLEYYDPIFKEKYDDFNKRRKDLEIFLNIASNYKKVDTFLSDMALEPPQDSIADVDAADKEDDILTLSTIHSAKGLEWHSVFILHAAEGFFPSSQSFESLEAIEEERRLMYVASTRAKQNLYVCYPMSIFSRHQGFTIAKPSRFIQNISEELAEEWLLESEL